MLELALHKDMHVTHFFHRSGLMSDKMHGTISDPSRMLSSQQKAGLFIDDIKRKVRLNPENYHTLIQYFSENKL